MAMVDTDWSIDRATGNIRYIGDDHNGAAPSYATVIQFHRWLQAFADDEAFSNDDELDIIDKTPSDRATDNIVTLLNGFNIDDAASEHLYDGSVIQDNLNTIYDGFVNFGNANVQLQIIQDGAVLTDDWWNKGRGGQHDGANNASILTDSGEAWTTDEWVGYTIYNTTDGSQGLITANSGTTITATLEGGTENDWDTNDNYLIGVPLNGDSDQGISHRFMLPVRKNGVDIDRRRLIGLARRYLNTYGEFKVNGTSRGNNVFAVNDSDDLNNTTAAATVAGWTTITNTEGLRLIDISGDGTDEEYYSEWNRDTFTINQFVERMKWLSRQGTASTLNGLGGLLFRGITHSFAHDAESGTAPVTNDEYVWGTAVISDGGAGTFTIGEAVHEDTATPAWKGRIMGGDLTVGAGGTLIIDVESGTLTNNDTFTGQTSGATAAINDVSPPTTPTATAGKIRIFAYDDDGTTGNTYGQILKGVAPVDNTILYEETTIANTITVNGTVTERTISTPFCGVSTGSAIIGAYGLGMEAADTGASDTFFDLGNNPITPPNNVTFTVSGLVSGEDRVLVTNDDGATGIDFTQMATDTTLSGAAETSVSINPTPGIPDNTPGPTGTIRIERDNGLYSRHAYTAVDEVTDTFTIASTDFSTNNATQPANVFLTYVDKLAAAADESYTTVFDSAQTLFIRVRDGGGTPIKTIETTGSLGSNGGSVTVNRIDDT